MFYIPEFRQQITYVPVLTDEDGQIQLLNTDPGIVLQGHRKGIASAKRAPRLRRQVQSDSNCTGTGNYKDSLGGTVSFVFTVVDGGNEVFLQGANGNGNSVFGVGRRVQ